MKIAIAVPHLKRHLSAALSFDRRSAGTPLQCARMVSLDSNLIGEILNSKIMMLSACEIL